MIVSGDSGMSNPDVGGYLRCWEVVGDGQVVFDKFTYAYGYFC